MTSARALRLFIAAATVGSALVAWPSQAVSRPRQVGVDWATWGYDVSRTGNNPSEAILGTGTVGGLQMKWKFDFPAWSYNAPVLASGVMVGNVPTDILYVGDNNGSFYALNADDGSVIWHRDNLGFIQSCFGPLGVVSTAVIDRASNRIYVIGGKGKLYALKLATGHLAAGGWPVQITAVNKPNEYVYSALTLQDGQLYVAVSAGCDRNGPYYGRIADVDTATALIASTFYVTDGKNTHIKGGAIWGWGGVAVDPANRDVYTVTGNARTDPEYYLYAEHVVRLTHGLAVEASNYPGLQGDDADFGSSPVLFDGPGSCGPQLVTVNKDGEIFLYNRDNIDAGPEDRLTISGLDFITVPAYSPATELIYIGSSKPSPDAVYQPGLMAFGVDTNCKLSLAWQQPVGGKATVSEPTVANGVVYYGNGNKKTLYAFDAATGAKLWDSGTTITSILTTEPIVVNGHVYVTSGNSLYEFGL